MNEGRNISFDKRGSGIAERGVKVEK